MKHIISVSKTYIHRGRHKHKPSTKKQWFVYYYDENGKFHSEKVSYLQAMYYKQQKLRRLKYYKIRLSLTDAPERNESGYKKATKFTKKLCSVGSTVIVDQDDKQPYDKFKRVVGKVTCSGKVLNAELLYNGHANISKQYCSKSEFSSESWAKKFGC